MGAGKSTLAALLASQLKRPWVDTDVWISTQHGKSISHLFKERGETWFRGEEKRILAYLGKRGEVVALGGGSMQTMEDAVLIKSTGALVYLSVSSSVAFHRIGSQTSRPLLARWDELYRMRQMLYQQAHIEVNGGHGLSHVYAEVMNRLHELDFLN